ncbi:ethylene-responsive transcription factor ERF014-like [Mangifera indica]|uniref:ethylene-responsive transcription factor ERF014-like n=1 Tax=Mangifera indica TaxID=29780 RepID=UPI001CFAA33D|nr:ethylene-responsive transcription factor ERF014-like [Mangifera indica]
MVKTEQKIQQDPVSKAVPSTSSSSSKKKKYKGVRMRSWGSWVSEIRAPNQKTRIWLGSYSTPEAAARAYDAALLCLKGSSANLNFPITSSHYIPDTVLSPKSIQRVAAAAANSENAATTTTTNPPKSPTLPSSSSSSSSSSLISSPSMSSSASDQLMDDDVFLLQPIEQTYNEASISMMDPLPWYNFDGIQSPKYVDQMFSSVSLFDLPPTIDDFLDEGDIRLWSFC